MSLKRILIIRHAESQEDLDPNLNGLANDKEIYITENGKTQTREISEKIKDKISGYNGLRVYSSPSNRVLQTVKLIAQQIGIPDTEIVSDSRIRNLNWGNTTPENIKDVEKERYQVGVLYYQFPGGDYTPDFIKGINQFTQELLAVGKRDQFPEVVLIATHGFALRILAKVLLDISDENFRWIKNPKNCYIADFQISNIGNISIDQPLETRKPIKNP